MEQLYLFNHRKTPTPKVFFVGINDGHKKIKISVVLFIFTCLLSNRLFSQADVKAPFNESFWNGYADKLQLGPKEREEFISAHKRDQSPAPAVSPQAIQLAPQVNNKIINPNNSIFAGPCVNADFELGDMTGWVRSCGFHPGYNPLGCCPNPNGQQTIMTGAGNDPFGGFPLVYPGGSFSLRLGNSGVNGQADRIEQTFLVSASNANFSYKYAVVFEDPNHPTNQQPFFQVEMIDSTGAAVPCTFYYVAAGSGIPGFFNSPTAGVIYKPWSTVLVDLTPYIGQNITIRFSTYDCSLGGHFGYAYIDGVCQSFSSGGTATVCAGASTTFCAPAGVDSYTWNGPGLTNYVGQCGTMSAPGVYTVSTTLFTGCPGPMFTYTLVNQVPPIADAGPSSTVCANNNTVNIGGAITGYPATPVWSSGGSGVFTSTSNINSTYLPSAADNAAGSVTITLTTAGNGICPAATDQMVISITPSPVVNAGTGGSNCNTNPFVLNGSVTGGASTGSWSGSGNGTFTPASNVLNASYTPGVADIAAGSVTLTLTSTNNGNCFADSDTLIIVIRQPATANAGLNQALCSTTPTIAVSGLIGGSSGTGVWSSSGAGAFNPVNTNLNTTYSVTPADIIAGQVIFTLTSTNNGPCPVATDTVKMRIFLPSTVTAGPNQFLCSSAGSITLAGSVAGISNTGNWTSSGLGVFSPASTTLNASYALTPADITAGIVDFTLTSTNNGPCASVRDTVRMKVRLPATVNAGLNQALCSTASSVNLAGTIGGGSSTGIWSGSGAGAFVPSNTLLSTACSITAADVVLGSVIFTLTSTNNGPCASVQDTVKMAIINIATITAGPNQFICSSGGSVNLLGAINSPSNTVIWTGNGAGSFLPSGSVITPTYNLTAADITAGAVTFTVSSTNNGPCPVVRDSVMITIKKLATINAGANQKICSNSPTLNLGGAIGGGATTVVWTSSGTGNFFPNTTNLITAYGATATDINAGSVVFTLTSTNNGPCPAVSDTVMMTIVKIATVNAGPNLYVCSNSGTLNLAGSVMSPSNTTVWSSNGSGAFLPNANLSNTTYSFSSLDVNLGYVTFSLTSTNNGVCPAVRDTVKMRIMKLAAVNAGPNQAICSTQGTFNLPGSVTGGGYSGNWTTSGNGSFNPNASSLNTSYAFTAQDISSGAVTFTLTSQNSAPCPEVSDSVNMVINTQAQVVAGPSQTICSSDGSVNLSGSISGGVGTVLWSSSGTGSFSPANTSSVTAYVISAADIFAGVLSFTLSSTNNGSCAKSVSTLVVAVKEKAKVNAGADKTICSSQLQVPLQGTISGVTSSGTWSGNGAGTFSPNATTASYSVSSADILQAGLMFVLTSDNNDVCPVVTDTMNVFIETKPLITVRSDTSLCDKYSMIPLSYTATGSAALQWATTGSGLFLPSNAPSATHYSLSAADKAGGNVSLMLGSSSNGPCGYTGATVKVNILKGPQADFSPSSFTIQIPGDPIQFTNLSTSADTYSWSFGDGENSSLTSPSHNYAEVGFYTATLLALNNNGCVDVTDKVLTVIADVQFANAFTPNTNGGSGGYYDANDNSNDVFFPFARGVVEYDMMIFNRWGELIFRSNDIKIGWDGYFNGKICQQDTYVWKVSMGFFDGRKYNNTGSVTLLR